MNILHVHEVDEPATSGGATMMYRLHQGLRDAGIDSKILCKKSQFRPSYSAIIPRGGFSARLERQLNRITVRAGLNDIHCLSTFGISKMPVFQNADVVHLHCIHGNFFNYLALPHLTESKTTVFTLHDMWPFTGHCAVSLDCERWKTGCGQCPYPATYPPIRRDATAWEWRLKRWVYSRSRLALVTPSSVQSERVRESILKHAPIHEIPNGVDTDTYEPLDRKQCRHLLQIPADKKVVMFAAAALNAPNKGGELLVGALSRLPETLKRDFILLLVGHGGEYLERRVPVRTFNLGYLHHDRLKAVAYSAADLFVLPSRGESLSLVLQESMSCGTPVVAFKAGGMVDLVRPGVTGYLAERDNAEDLSAKITTLLDDDGLRSAMGRQCRKIAIEEYSLRLHVQRHIELYRELTSK